MLLLLQVAAVTCDYERQMQQLHATHAAQHSTSKITELNNRHSMQEVRDVSF